MAQRTMACTACHGEQGRAGPDGYYPRLAGKPAGYLYNQLVNFREGRRHYTLMRGLIDPLDDGYLREIAQHFSSLDLPYPPPAKPDVAAAILERGRTLVNNGDESRKIPACTQCHGTALTGVVPNVPGLLGLPRDYINGQLGGWRTGQRSATAPDCMGHIAKSLTHQDISAVSAWLSAQAVPGNGKPALTAPPKPPGAPDIQCGKSPSATRTEAPADAQITRGSYLARIGNCALCHTARGGEPFAGGRDIKTPFGTVFSSNISPDKHFGIGSWTADDFWQALHHGKSRDGRLLNPAFPYTSYTHVTREDADALWAYLRSLQPSTRTNMPDAMQWPFGTQAALWAWRSLYFTPAAIAPASTANQDQQTARGQYLVQGLGHCAECHTQRDALGGFASSTPNLGGVLPGSQWYAPSLYRSEESSVASWTSDDTQVFLRTGHASRATASGPMAEVILHGTQYLTESDATAMARYLKTLGPTAPVSATGAASAAPAAPLQSTAPGAILYDKHCAQCHGNSGEGRSGAYPALAGNRAVNMPNTSNLALKVLNGGFGPATAGHPRPFGMPPYRLALSDAEVAAVLTYIRSAWGNKGGAVPEFDINRIRTSSTP
jgi:cytochrome c553